MATDQELNHQNEPWKKYQLLLFRFFFIFILLQIIPLDYKFYQQIFSISWFKITYADLFNLSKYVPIVFDNKESWADWALFAGIAILAAVIWSFKDAKKQEYNFLYYILRGVSRYRLAAAVLTYGFLKLFALLAPEPSVSTLNTNYGEFTDWKIFSITLGGAKPYYQTFLGIVEILSAILLLNRKTASIGALIIVSFLGNVFLSNLAYGGEEYIYSLYLIILALFILSRDVFRLYNLLFLEIPAIPNQYYPVFTRNAVAPLLKVLKYTFFFFFIILLGYKTYKGQADDQYQVPNQTGIPNAKGIYNVKLFVLNGDTIPYSTVDTNRWKDVAFEKWATLSIRRNRPVKVDYQRSEYFAANDKDKIYESAETNGRLYFSYQTAPDSTSVLLENKNRNYKGQKLALRYSRPDQSHIVLDGINENKDTIHVELEKLHKIYLLQQGRGKDLKL